MPKVYAVQNQMRFDHDRKELVPKFDYRPAEEYGEVQFLLSPNAAPFNARSVLNELHSKLSEMQPEDFLLLIGNPVLIGLVTAVAADYTDGHINFLQWSGKDQRYVRIAAEDIFVDFRPTSTQ